jgi:PEP-CTERM motif-containing protein
MGWRLWLPFVALTACAVPSAAAPLCVASVGSVPVLDPLSTSAAPGELTVTCSDLAVGPSLVNVQQFFNTSVVQSGTPDLVTTLGTTYPGVFTGPNAVTFLGVSVLGPAFGFTIEDILVNPSLLGAGAQVVSFVSVSPSSSLPIPNPQQTVAIVGPSPVPEPGTLMLFGIGFAAWRGARRLRPTRVRRR